MAVKRRIIWMSDEDWAKLGEKADLRSLSRSAYIVASTVGGGFITPEAMLRDPVFMAFRPAPKPGARKAGAKP